MKSINIIVLISLIIVTACSTESKKVVTATKTNPDIPDVLLPEVKCVEVPSKIIENRWEQKHLSCQIQKGSTWSSQ